MKRPSYHIHCILPILYLFISVTCMGQQIKVSGQIINQDKETMAGAIVQITNTSIGIIADANGNYSINLDSGKTYVLSFSFVGYHKKELTIQASQDIIQPIQLLPYNNQLHQVVVSAGKYAQEIKRVTVSTDIIKPYLIENKAVLNMEGIINQLPGVNIIDGQANIRGGSGWTYGAGSRVLVLLDDLPFITGDANQVQWKFLPVENIEQMEVIKGASSVLYGSSALNGVINIRTSPPKQKPITQFTLIGGMYNQLKRDSTRWSYKTRFQSGFNAFDSRKIKRIDLVTAINYTKDNGYRLGEQDERLRLSIFTNYHHPHIAGLKYGINTSLMNTQAQSFLLWENWQLAYTAQDSITTNSHSTNVSFDPHIDYTIAGVKHRFRSRVQRLVNDITVNDPTINQDNASWVFYGEYQVQKILPKQLGIVSVGTAINRVRSFAPLYGGVHYAQNIAPFIQGDLHWRKWSASMGYRFEHFMMDGKSEQKNIIRAGLNLEVTTKTFLRTSFGQGYRFPSIAERYVTTSAGAVNVFPNPELQSETGWNTEIGVRQGFGIKSWNALLDVAYFHTEYQQMTEFNFGQWRSIDLSNPINLNPATVLKSYGFKSVNVGDARITGVDASLVGNGKLNKITITSLLGYTYIVPVSLTPDKVFAIDSGGNINTYKNTSSDTLTNRLKYRYEYLAKADIEIGYGNFSVGYSLRYNSYMKNIDLIFESPLIPGVKQARALNKRGDWVMDIRLAYKFSGHFKLNFIVNNFTHHEQMTRPADMRPPRIFVLQATYKVSK
jgi:outer membrane cobalamin receptor